MLLRRKSTFVNDMVKLIQLHKDNSEKLKDIVAEIGCQAGTRTEIYADCLSVGKEFITNLALHAIYQFTHFGQVPCSLDKVRSEWAYIKINDSRVGKVRIGPYDNPQKGRKWVRYSDYGYLWTKAPDENTGFAYTDFYELNDLQRLTCELQSTSFKLRK